MDNAYGDAFSYGDTALNFAMKDNCLRIFELRRIYILHCVSHICCTLYAVQSTKYLVQGGSLLVPKVKEPTVLVLL